LAFKWLDNVSDLGLVGAGFIWAARILTGTYAGYYLVRDDSEMNRGLVANARENLDESWGWEFISGYFYGRFPYGLDVEPAVI